MPVKCLAHVRDWRLTAQQLQVEFEVQILDRETQVATRSTNHATLSAPLFEAGIKNLIITYAQNHYAITLLADEILLR